MGTFFRLLLRKSFPKSSSVQLLCILTGPEQISVFAKEIISVSSSTSLTILLVMNAVGLPGRLICGLMADKLLGPVKIITPVCVIAGLCLYGWTAVNSIGSLLTFCVVYGFFGAGIQSILPAACASLTTDLTKIGTRTGMCLSCISIACLLGPPLAGALIQRDEGRFLYAQVFGGSSLMCGSLLLVAAIISSGLDFKTRL